MATRKTGRVPSSAKSNAALQRKALQAGRKTATSAIASYDRMVRSLARQAPKLRPKQKAIAEGSLLFAEGDSWFDYPLCDVLSTLRHAYGYRIEKVAHAGHTVESMAYDPEQLAGVVERYRDLAAAGREPAAVLLSGGGNDIAGSAIESLLNHRNDPSRGFNESVMTGVFDQRIRSAMISEIGALSEVHRVHFGKVPPVLIHGYDYAVPDNRGYHFGPITITGPWLAPQFQRRGYVDLNETAQLTVVLIDRFNEVAKSVASKLANVTYVDLRRTLSNELAGRKYRKDWANELHPTQPGFLSVATRMNAALQKVLG